MHAGDSRKQAIDEACKLMDHLLAQTEKGLAEDDNLWLRVQACLAEKRDHDDFTFAKLMWLRSNYSPEQLVQHAASPGSRQELLELWTHQHKDLEESTLRRKELAKLYKRYTELIERRRDETHFDVKKASKEMQNRKRQNRKMDVDKYFFRIDRPPIDPPAFGEGWEEWDEDIDARGKAPPNLPIGCPLNAEEREDILEIFADTGRYLGRPLLSAHQHQDSQDTGVASSMSHTASPCQPHHVRDSRTHLPGISPEADEKARLRKEKIANLKESRSGAKKCAKKKKSFNGCGWLSPPRRGGASITNTAGRAGRERHHPARQPPGDQIRIVLVGKTNRGKSSLMNAIAGSSMFTSQEGRSTKELASVEGVWQTLDGEVIRYTIVDTPGVADSAFDDKNTYRDLEKYFLEEAFANLILFVTVAKDTCNERDTARLDDYKKLFGSQALDNNFAVMFKKFDPGSRDQHKKKLELLDESLIGHAVVGKFFFVDDDPDPETGAFRATHEALDVLMKYARSLEPVETVRFKGLSEDDQVHLKTRGSYIGVLRRPYRLRPSAECADAVLTLCDQEEVSDG